MPSLRVGGAEKKIMALLRYLNRDEFAPSLIVQDGCGPLWQDLPCDVHFVDLDKSKMRFTVPSLRQVLRETRPDLIFSPMEHTCVAVALARRFEGLSMPLVFSVESNLRRSLLEVPLAKRWIYRSFYKRFYPDATKVVAVSRGVADLFTTEIPEVKDRIVILPNPVVPDSAEIEKRNKTVDPWLNSEFPVVVACGRLVKAKSFDTLIRAFAKVRERVRARLLILGEGPERPYLEDLVRRCHLRGSVKLPGAVENPFASMKKASVFVLSSQWEGMPGVLIEAMASGAPCVATDCNFGPRELIEHGRNGLLARVGDVESLAEQITLMLQNRELAKNIGAAAKHSVDRYGEAAACLAHEELFHSLLATRRARGALA